MVVVPLKPTVCRKFSYRRGKKKLKSLITTGKSLKEYKLVSFHQNTDPNKISCVPDTLSRQRVQRKNNDTLAENTLI